MKRVMVLLKTAQRLAREPQASDISDRIEEAIHNTRTTK